MLGKGLIVLTKIYKAHKLSIDKIRSIQERKLRKLISYAIKEVDFYRKLYNDLPKKVLSSITLSQLNLLPIIGREEFSLLSFAERTNNSLRSRDSIFYLTQTDGTTASPFTIYFTREELRLRHLYRLRMLFANGLKIFDKICIIGISREREILSKKWNQRLKGSQNFVLKKEKTRFPKKWYQRLGIFRVYPIFKIDSSGVEKIIKVNPEIIITNLKQARAFRDYIKEISNLNSLLIKKFFISDETISDKEREEFETIFGAEIFNLYASREFCLIAWECQEHNGYHIEMDRLIIEVLGEKKESIVEGEVVITALDQYFMPLIRYRLGDWVKISLEPCRCGRKTPLIKEIRRLSKDEKEKFSSKNSIII